VLFHANFPTFSGGFVGVDVFFVISGFLITRMISEEVETTGRFDFGGFYVRRARRLVPALFTTFVFCFVAAFLLFTPQHFRRFGEELLSATTSLSNMFFWSESGYFNTASDFKPLLHTWSLSVEEQFYLVWPAVLYLVQRSIGKRGVWVLMAIVGGASLYLNVRMAHGFSCAWLVRHPWLKDRFADGASTIFYLTPYRLFEFAIGAALVWIKPRSDMPKFAMEIATFGGLAAILWCVLRYDSNTVFPSYNAFLPCIGAALLILTADASMIGIAVRNKACAFIGEISYSLYLVHWPILVFYKYWKTTPISELERVALVTLSGLIAYLLYRFVETPLRGKKRTTRLSRAGVGFACSSLLLGMSLLSATVWANDGFPWRLPPLPQEISSEALSSNDFQVDQYGGAGFPEPTAWIGTPSNGQADFVFIGDSHAGQYKTGFKQDIVDPLKKSAFFSTASCLVLPGLTRITPGTDWDHWCTKVLSDALIVVNRSPGATVFIAESWDFQIYDAALISDKNPIYQHQDMDAALKVVGTKLDELRNALGEHRLVLVGEVPGAGVDDPIGCFLRPKYVKPNCEKILSTPEQSNPARKVNEFLRAYAQHHRNVSFFDPFSTLCDGKRCHTFENGRVLYSDGFHLSKFGSRVVAGALRDELMGDTVTNHTDSSLVSSSR